MSNDVVYHKTCKFQRIAPPRKTSRVRAMVAAVETYPTVIQGTMTLTTAGVAVFAKYNAVVKRALDAEADVALDLTLDLPPSLKCDV